MKKFVTICVTFFLVVMLGTAIGAMMPTKPDNFTELSLLSITHYPASGKQAAYDRLHWRLQLDEDGTYHYDALIYIDDQAVFDHLNLAHNAVVTDEDCPNSNIIITDCVPNHQHTVKAWIREIETYDIANVKTGYVAHP